MAKREIECYKYSELDSNAKEGAMENSDYLLDCVFNYNRDLVIKDTNERIKELQARIARDEKEIKELNAKKSALVKMVDEMFSCQCSLGYTIEDLEKANEEYFFFNKFGEPLWYSSDINCEIKLRNMF